MVRLIEMVVLGGPHLILSDLGGNNGFALGQFIEFFNHVLRFDRILLFIGERIGVAPLFYLLDPWRTLFAQLAEGFFFDQTV